MSSKEEQAIRVLPFSGKKTDWEGWEAKFLMKAGLKGWDDYLIVEYDIPTKDAYDELDSDNEEDQQGIIHYEKNKAAFSELLLSMDYSSEAGNVAFSIVKSYRNKENPFGNAYKAFTSLKKKYSPTTAPTLVKMSKEFYHCALKEGGDPDIYITKMEYLRNKLVEMDPNQTMSDKQFIVTVLNNLPKEYENQVEQLEQLLDQDNLEIEDMREKLNLRFERVNGNNKSFENKGNDKALIVHGKKFSPKFKGKCTYCGKIGHKASVCFSNPKNKSNNETNINGNKEKEHKKKQFQGECFYCKKKGHRESECFKKKKDNEDPNHNGNRNRPEIALICTERPNLWGNNFNEIDYNHNRRMNDICFIAMDRGNEAKYHESDTDEDNIGYGQTQNPVPLTQMNAFYENPMFDDVNEMFIESVVAPRDPHGLMTHQMKHDLWNASHDNANLPHNENELYEFWYTIGLFGFEYNQERCVSYGREMEAICLSIDVTDVYELLSNIIRLPYLVETREKHKFNFRVLDLIAFYGVEWLSIQRLEEGENNESNDVLEEYRNPPRTSRKRDRDIAHMAIERYNKVKNEDHDMEKRMWIADSGATCHVTCSEEGMFECVAIDCEIEVGNGDTIKSTLLGKKKVHIIQQDGSMDTITLEDVKYVPNMNTNLLSITKMLHSGWNIGNNGTTIKLTNDFQEIMFDKAIPYGTGFLMGVEMVSSCEYTYFMAEGKKFINIDVNKYHQILGHPGIETTKLTAKRYNIKLTGEFHPCRHCAIAKARQKKTVLADKEGKSTTAGERICFDLSSVIVPSFGGSRFWLLVVDEATHYCWSFFIKAKDEVTEVMNKVLISLKASNRRVRFIRCDNAGENIAFKKFCETNHPYIMFELTSPGTPQQNGLVERLFATLYGRVRAMLNNAYLTEEIREPSWAEAGKTATDAENVLVTYNNRDSAHFKFFGTDPKTVEPYHPFGEIVIVFDHAQRRIRGKLTDRGYAGIYLGRSHAHGSDTYRILRISTKQVIHSRDVQWMNCFYGQYKNKPSAFIEPNHPGDTEIDENLTYLSRPTPNYESIEDNVQNPIETQYSQHHTSQNVPITILDTNPTLDRQHNEEDQANIEQNDVPPIPPTQDISRIGRIEQEVRNRIQNENIMYFGTNETHQMNAPTLDDERQDLHDMEPINQEGRDDVDDRDDEEVIDQNIVNQHTNDQAMIMKDNHFFLQDIISTSTTILHRDQIKILIDRLPKDFVPLNDAMFVVTDKNQLEEVKNMSPTCYRDYINPPKTFDEAWHHPIPWIRESFREAIKKEHQKMKIHKVWEKVKRKNMEKGRVPIKSKWIFEIKRNGIFRARLVACGYSQVAGVDYTDIYSPVVNDVAFRLAILIQICKNYESRVVDIETAFLHGELNETIYMECPEGLDHNVDEVVLLKKSLYGLVQSARQFFIKLIEILERIGFVQSIAEPCLLYRKGDKGLVYMVIHVDDCYMIGESSELDKTISLIQKNGLKIKVETNTNDYLSCEIKFDDRRNKVWMGQPHLIKKIEMGFRQLIKSNYNYRTPGTPGVGLKRPINEDDPHISDKEQKIYRSVVGSLLQLVKYSRPDLSNPVRELSKCSSSALPCAFKEMLRVLKFVIDTKSFGLHINPTPLIEDEFVIDVYSDSDWGGDREARHSVTGYIIFVNKVPMIWKSRSQRIISLSSSEAEYYAVSEASKDVMFIIQIIESIGFKVRKPIIINVDNIGAIFISENKSATARTKHIDIRYHYVRQLIQSGIVKINFVKSNENKADPFTKNVTTEIYENRMKDIIIHYDEI